MNRAKEAANQPTTPGPLAERVWAAGQRLLALEAGPGAARDESAVAAFVWRRDQYQDDYILISGE